MGVKSGGSDIGRKSRNVKVLRMRLSISRNVPTSAMSVFHALPASHEPYSGKSTNPGEWGKKWGMSGQVRNKTRELSVELHKKHLEATLINKLGNALT